MIALDSNVLARYLLNDDPDRSSAAAALLKKRQTYTAPPTVLLELVWVLSVNDCSRSEISRALKHLLGLPNFKPREFEALLTFDRSLAKLAGRIGAALGVTQAG